MATITTETQLNELLKHCWIPGEYGSKEFLSNGDARVLASQVFSLLKRG